MNHRTLKIILMLVLVLAIVALVTSCTDQYSETQQAGVQPDANNGYSQETSSQNSESLNQEQEASTPIIEQISPKEAHDLVLANSDNPRFQIIDTRSAGAYAIEHIKHAINIDFESEDVLDQISKLDKDGIYLVYRVGRYMSNYPLYIMQEAGFKEVYGITGGILNWNLAGFPVVQGTSVQVDEPKTTDPETLLQVIKSIMPPEAFDLIQGKQANPDFIIIDTRIPEAFSLGRIENAINIDFSSETFRNELDKLDRTKTYLIYYQCQCGDIDQESLSIMKELNFREVYNIWGGLDKWRAEDFPIVTDPQVIEGITPQAAYNIIEHYKDISPFIIIDLRTEHEFIEGHIEGAINKDYTLSTFDDELDELDRFDKYIVYCQSDSCAEALTIMSELGFHRVYSIAGGIDGWLVEGFPLIE